MRQKPDAENCCIFQRKVAMTAAAAASASVSVGATAEQAAVSAAADVNDRLSGRSTASTVSPQTLTYIYFYYLRRLRLATTTVAAAGSAMGHGQQHVRTRAYLGRLIFNSLNRLANRSGRLWHGARAMGHGQGQACCVCHCLSSLLDSLLSECYI